MTCCPLVDTKSTCRYIIAQIFGAYVASLIVYHQWESFIHEAEAALKLAGVYEQIQFTPTGTAGIFALYLPTGQKYGSVFLNEFVNVRSLLSVSVVGFLNWCYVQSAIVALVVWACLDPTNVAIPPAFAPFLISIA